MRCQVHAVACDDGAVRTTAMTKVWLPLVCAAWVGFALVVAACSGTGSTAAPTPAAAPSTAVSTATVPSSSPTTNSGAGSAVTNPAPAETAPKPTIRGGVPVAVIAVDGRGSARVQATPFALRQRRLDTIDLLPPPPDDGVFRFTTAALDDPAVAEAFARSTWGEECPVEPGDLTYLTLSFIGFDGEPHTGELIVHASVDDEIVSIFEQLFNERFPIEEMRIVEQSDLLPPQFGDANNTSAFTCRRVTGGSRFSEHAYGLAIDINPFQNPYIKRLSVIPALAGSFGEREWRRDGMIRRGDPVVAAFNRIGWSWGGEWNSLKDYQHFSHNNR